MECLALLLRVIQSPLRKKPKRKIKHFSLLIGLIFLSAFYCKGQYVPDSADVVKSYKEKITTGKTIKFVGISVMTAGGLTTLISAFKVLESFGANTTADHFFIMGLVTTLIGIPITIIGVHTQESNERKLEIYYRLGLRTMGNTPTIGLKYRF